MHAMDNLEHSLFVIRRSRASVTSRHEIFYNSRKAKLQNKCIGIFLKTPHSGYIIILQIGFRWYLETAEIIEIC